MTDDTITPAQVRMAKAALGLSNPQIAQETGLNRNTINNAEAGDRMPSRSTRIALRKFFEGRGVVFVFPGDTVDAAGIIYHEPGSDT